MKMLDHTLQLWVAGATMLLLAGCQTTVQEGEKPLKKDVSILGYTLGSPKRHDELHKLYIPRAAVKAELNEPHLQTEFVNVLISEFTKEQTFEIVSRAEEADGTLKTTITKIDMNSIQYVDSKTDRNAASTPMAWRVWVHADVVLTDNRTGEEIWRANDMRGTYDFNPAADFTEIRREAILQACADLSKDICDNVSEPW